MLIDVRHNFPEVERWLAGVQQRAPSAVREALNRTAEIAKADVESEMARVFDRPVPFTLRSLKLYYANTASLKVVLWFRQRSADADKLWALPQIEGGARAMKPMELRLQRAGLLPKGWMVMPGAAMPLDAYGNMSRGEVSRILNVLGTYMEAGYNKANAKTVKRLRAGSAKKGVYGFEYWVNPVVRSWPSGAKKQAHLQPGVYRRVYTAFGSSLKPMMIFVNRAKYRGRLHFARIVEKAFDVNFPREFDKAMQSVLTTGSASQARLSQFGPVSPSPRQRGGWL